jgi:hypothetical protein
MSNIIRKTLRWQTWLHGLIGAVVGGAANSVANIAIAPEVFNLNEGFCKLGQSALAAAIISAALYLKTAPVPPVEEEKQLTPPV